MIVLLQQRVAVGVPSWSGVKRFGSMRGQELRDSISQIAAHYGVSLVDACFHEIMNMVSYQI